MKKVGDLIKPFAAIILGALLLLAYLNDLQAQGGQLIIGIFALIFAIYYMGIGIVSVIVGDKMPAGAKKVFDVLSIALFPLFMFIYYVANCADWAAGLGPSGWIIIILSMNGSIIFSALFVVAAFVKVPVLKRLAQLFGAIFVLALLLNLVFTVSGNPNALGDINVINVVIYSLFTFMLLNSFKEEQPLIEEKK